MNNTTQNEHLFNVKKGYFYSPIKHKGYRSIYAYNSKTKRMFNLGAYTIQEWEQAEIRNDKIIFHSRDDKDQHKEIRFKNGLDYYCDVNNFIKIKGRTKNDLRGLSTFVIDIDNASTTKIWKYEVDEFLKVFNKELNKENNTLPIPTQVVKSGTGIQLIYNFEQIPLALKFLYDLVLKNIIQEVNKILKIAQRNKYLKGFHIDGKATNNEVQLFRLGGINSKSNLQVERLNYGVKYSIDILMSMLGITSLSSKKEVGIKTVNTTNYAEIPYWLNDLLIKRIQSLEQVQAFQNDNNKISGFRFKLIFLYYNTQLPMFKSEYEAKQETINFNKKFIKPLSERELNNIFMSDTKDSRKAFYFKNETFNHWLGIGEGVPEMYVQKNKQSIESVHKARNERRARAREQKEQARIKLLSDPDYTNKQIATLSNVDVRTVRRWREKHKIPSKNADF